jgi:hypothetical protein
LSSSTSVFGVDYFVRRGFRGCFGLIGPRLLLRQRPAFSRRSLAEFHRGLASASVLAFIAGIATSMAVWPRRRPLQSRFERRIDLVAMPFSCCSVEWTRLSAWFLVSAAAPLLILVGELSASFTI